MSQIELFDILDICKQMTYSIELLKIELLDNLSVSKEMIVIDTSKTWNYFTMCQQTSSGSLKNAVKMCL